jgi:hypothetical protein
LERFEDFFLSLKWLKDGREEKLQEADWMGLCVRNHIPMLQLLGLYQHLNE